MPLAPGFRLGLYEVVGLIGAGGMGEVYTARDVRLGRIVPNPTGAGAGTSLRYLVLEHIEGETLATRLEKGALPLPDALRIGLAVLSALDAAHRHGTGEPLGGHGRAGLVHEHQSEPGRAAARGRPRAVLR